jgi:diguanylate cyclase (GGDEF)-like protein
VTEESTGSLLIVDDDPQIVRMLKDLFKRQYDVITAGSGDDAAALLDEHEVLAVLADHMMPGLTGVELLERASEVQPDAVRILITASERVDDLRDAVNRARVHRFVSKPLRVMDLRTTVTSAIREMLLEQENKRLVAELSEKNQRLQKALSEVQNHERRLEREVENRTQELRIAMAELEKLALRDGLTGLYNHRFLQEALTSELARGARYNHAVSLVFLDVDHFKNYNDLHGHPAGDSLLKKLAAILTDTGDMPELRFRGRMTDIAARYGGEEFVVVLPQTSKEGAALRADRLRQSIEEFPFPSEGDQPLGKVTISVGVATYPDDALTKQTLLERADQALYEAKRSGRNRVCVAGAANDEEKAG